MSGSINMHAALILLQKVAKSTAGHLFLYTLPTRHLFFDRKLLRSTAGHLFLRTLATRHLVCSRKISRMRITTAGRRGFKLIARSCRACKYRVLPSRSHITVACDLYKTDFLKAAQCVIEDPTRHKASKKRFGRKSD